jgi:DNA-binding MarR family transcriptional regulator
VSELTRIYEDLAGLKTGLWNAAEERLRADFGLPLRYFQAMSAIGLSGACQVDDVAAELGISRRAAQELIDDIETEGYCHRSSRGGQAIQALELTPRGQSLLTEAGRAFDDELERRLGAVVPPAALARFAATLRRLRRPGVPARHDPAALPGSLRCRPRYRFRRTGVAVSCFRAGR